MPRELSAHFFAYPAEISAGRNGQGLFAAPGILAEESRGSGGREDLRAAKGLVSEIAAGDDLNKSLLLPER